jgi:hypothetical protein
MRKSNDEDDFSFDQKKKWFENGEERCKWFVVV